MFLPIASDSLYPNWRSAALEKNCMIPCSSITIIASGIVSRIERKCRSLLLTVVLEALLSVDVDHDAAEPGRSAIGTIDGRANGTYPVPRIRIPVHPVLNVEIAAGIDRLLHGACRAVAILRIEQGKKKIVVDGCIRSDAEELAGGGGPAQSPGRQFEVPGADADLSAPPRAFWSSGS